MASRVIAVFRSTEFDLSWPEEGIEQSPPLGKDCAAFIAEALRDKGAILEFQEPIEGTEGWVVDVEVKGMKFSLFIHWAPLDEPPEDYWVIQPSLRRSLLTGLFRKAPGDEALLPVVDLLREVLDSEVFRDTRWLSREEFAKLY